MTELQEVLGLLEDRLIEHDNSRKEVQSQLQTLRSMMLRGADSLEERISGEIHKDFCPKEERILGLIAKLNEGDNDLDTLKKQAQEILSREWRYVVRHFEKAKSFVYSYKLKVSPVKIEREFDFGSPESIANQLQEHLDKFCESIATAQGKLADICNERRSEAEELEKRINGELEVAFSQEDARIQKVVKHLKERIDSENSEEVKELARKAKVALVKNQKYSLSEWNPDSNYDLVVKKEASLSFIDFEGRSPTDFTAKLTKKGEVSISFSFFSGDELAVLKEIGSSFEVEVEMREKSQDGEGTLKKVMMKYALENGSPIFLSDTFSESTTHCLKIRVVHQETSTKWSDEKEFTTSSFSDFCVWKECPEAVDFCMKYSVDKENPRAARNINGNYYCTIVGNTYIPLDKVTSWSVKVLKSKNNDGGGICVGVAPSDIDQSKGNKNNCGWYLECFNSKLCSGPPQYYDGKEFGPRKERGRYVRNGDIIGVVMNTIKSELSFVVNGVNLGVAYEGIPLDKPLVPCVLLAYKGDSVELDTSEVKEIVVDSSIPVPSKITTKNVTWDSITLTWDAVERASFYQIQVNGKMSLEASTTKAFTKTGLLPDTEHTFMVRVVRGNKVGKWSDVTKGRTRKVLTYEGIWKECPDNVDGCMKYSVDEKNPRIATRISDSGLHCTIIGNTPLPLNKVTSWSIKILKSQGSDGNCIHIGVAPSDINQNEKGNCFKYGLYLNCWSSTLWSGPPHYYHDKEYGARKEKNGEYIHTGDSVGVVMDTAKGDLSFVLNGMNIGAAYKKIPLDKPLVPCVLLGKQGDSVELDTSDLKDINGDSSISASSLYEIIKSIIFS